MNIQSINAVNYANYTKRNDIAAKKQEAPQPQTSFDGIWSRMSRSYVDKTSFYLRAYYPFIDGVKPTKTEDAERRLIVDLGDNGMTVDEGNKALDFILKGKTDKENYEAAKKLSKFMERTVDEYNPMFMELEDKADETEKTKKVHITRFDVDNLIREYEFENGILKRPAAKKTEEIQEILTSEEFMKKLQEEGIA